MSVLLFYFIVYVIGVFAAIVAVRHVNEKVVESERFDGIYIFFSWMIVCSIVGYVVIRTLIQFIRKFDTSLNKLVKK